MSSYSATVNLSPLRSALVNLPPSIANVLFNSNIVPQNVVLELVWQKRGIKGNEGRAYVGWTGMVSKDNKESILEIDPTFALNLGLEPRTKVTVNIKVNNPQAHTVHLEPVDASDWEIVEIHAGFLESWMINQVRAISPLHPITVYPSATSIASLKVIKIEPEPGNSPTFAQLSPDSEVVIAPKVRKKTTTSTKKKSKKQERTAAAGPCSLMRGVTLPHPSYPETDETTLQVYADESLLYPLQNAEFVSVTVIRPGTIMSRPESSEAAELAPATSVVAKLVPYSESTEGHVGLSFALASALNICDTVGNMVRLEPAAKPVKSSSTTLILHPYVISSAPSSLKLKGEKQQQQDSSLAESIKKLLEGQPITQRMQLPVLDDLPYGGLLEMEDGADGSWMKNIGALKLGSELVRAQSAVSPRLSELNKPASERARKLVGIDKDLASFKSAVKNSTGGTLIYGTRGCGKTAVLREIEHDLNQDLIHTVWFSCGTHGEKQLQYLKDTVKRLFLEAAWYAPSVIILDDVDKLIPAEQEHRDSSKSLQLAEIFKQLANQTMATRKVSILATTQAKESLHSLLISSHVFNDVFHLKSPDKDVREVILKEAVSSLGIHVDDKFDLLEIAGSTEGYQPSDLWTLVERANHEAILAQIESSSSPDALSESQTITQKDFDKALADFVPAGLRGVKLQKSNTSWTDIGGLKETKSVLLETLEWPTRYAPIFANCPLRLRSGLLLYGYPGCGKTLLASAVAAQCGLNFISIKGPEILNKYIGASEQSVRELFERAQAAKPCILFFDEFDSIAPKRGHDSTGVTDRVVNQMLTQMDGAEGLDGVYVLAATSRPDLIDSALLRPGRLDKSLICDMPNAEDRMDILQAIQAKMKINKEVDLWQVAELTDGYSGADLQALMYNAYLDAIHDVVDLEAPSGSTGEANGSAEDVASELEYFQIDNSAKQAVSAAEKARLKRKLEKMISTPDKAANGDANDDDDDVSADVEIKWSHLQTSLKDTKPSISVKERMKLQAVYSQFVGGRSGDMPNGTASTDIGGRATLA